MKTPKTKKLGLIERLRNHLSHHPKLYAFIVGLGVVFFWRGAWISIDMIHTQIISYASPHNLLIPAWWDGPLSLLIGIIILDITGAFVPNFIGNELILSGLRSEETANRKIKKLEISEIEVISDVKEELSDLSKKLEKVELENYKKVD
jgi:hypothetical protein